MNTHYTRSNKPSRFLKPRFLKATAQLSLGLAFIGSLASCAIPFIDNESDYKVLAAHALWRCRQI